MGPPECRDVSQTHSLFAHDLKVYQKSHEILRNINEVIVQASHDTGACYGVSKCGEILFERGKDGQRRGIRCSVRKNENDGPRRK